MGQTFTVEKLKELLIEHDDAVLKTGSHKKYGRDFCAMEFVAMVAGEPWTDNPQCVHPGLAAYCRQLNDATWPSDKMRTKTMLPLLAEVFDTRELPINIASIAHETIRQILPIALESAAALHPEQAHKDALMAAAKTCREAPSQSAARSAAWSAESAARSAAESAARSAAESAASAASAGRSAAWSAESAAWSAESAVRSAAWSAASAAWSAESAASAASAAWSASAYTISINIVIAEIRRARGQT